MAGSRQVVVRAPTAIDNYIDVLDEALAAAQEALDLLGMRSSTALVLEGADAHDVVWWTEPKGLVLRVTSVSDFSFSSSATATVRNSEGNIVPPPPTPPLVWHPSFRYFRLSQTTSDLFDSYRNVYLALESVLSTVEPQRTLPNGRLEGEGVWLKRALQQVDANLPLSAYAPAGAANAVDGVFGDLYKGTRTGVFHAKSGRPVLLPHDSTNRQPVIDSLERLSRLYLDMARKHLAARRPSSAMTYAGFDLATGFGAEVVISDDVAPEGREDRTINPSGGSIASLTTRPAPELNRPGLKFWLGQAPVANVTATVPVVRRLGLVTDGNLLTVDRLDEPLSLSSVHSFEAQLGLRLINLEQPRFRFNT